MNWFFKDLKLVCCKGHRSAALQLRCLNIFPPRGPENLAGLGLPDLSKVVIAG